MQVPADYVMFRKAGPTVAPCDNKTLKPRVSKEPARQSMAPGLAEVGACKGFFHCRLKLPMGDLLEVCGRFKLLSNHEAEGV